MTSIRKVLRVVRTLLAFALLACWLFPLRAEAYIDPGTGSFVLQMMLAAFFAGLLALKMFWRRIVTIMRRLWSGRDSKDHGSSN